jgi:hypothetical protein
MHGLASHNKMLFRFEKLIRVRMELMIMIVKLTIVLT